MSQSDDLERAKTRRRFLSWIGAGAMYASAGSALADDAPLCEASKIPDLALEHPFNFGANARWQAYLNDLRNQKKPMPTDAEIAMRRNKDCAPCSRVLNRLRTELVWYNDGTLPILLAVPHGGTELVLEVNPRQNRDAAEQFNINSAIYTYDMARIVRRVLQERFNQEPYMVVCLGHRRYVDVNRPPRDGYVMRMFSEASPEDASTLPIRYRRSGAPLYFEYHCAMQQYVNQINRRYNGNALLIELTGGFSLPNAISLYTMQGMTIKKMRQRVGDSAIQGKQSLAALLENRGYEADPASVIKYPNFECASRIPVPSECTVETAENSGNYTINRYGAHQNTGIDAIQMNVGRALRTTEFFERTGRDIGNALADFLQKYYFVT